MSNSDGIFVSLEHVSVYHQNVFLVFLHTYGDLFNRPTNAHFDGLQL